MKHQSHIDRKVNIPFPRADEGTEVRGYASQGNILWRIWRFYYEGFRSMTVGRVLWAIILIKLFIIFAILRVFFFQPTLTGTDEEKAEKVRESLIKGPTPSPLP